MNVIEWKGELQFLSEFETVFKEEKEKLPYHINIFDELRGDENAHSRIFAQLLRYSKGGKFPILEMFLNEVCKFGVTIENPTVEKVDSCGRIDIPIFDDNYVVIIENKYNGAIDQPEQIARYIQTIQGYYKRKIEEIYVVYMPWNECAPADNSWTIGEKSYKEEFEERFASVPYKCKVYEFLKDILPKIDKKEKFLISTIEQYIDNLEYWFGTRKINENMNKALQDTISENFGLKNMDIKELFSVLGEKEIILSEVKKQFDLLKSEKMIHFFKGIKEKLSEEYPEGAIVFNSEGSIKNVGLKLTDGGKTYLALLECNNDSVPNLYVGIRKQYGEEKAEEISCQLETILKNSSLLDESDNEWYGWRYTNLEGAETDLLELLKNIKNKIIPIA